MSVWYGVLLRRSRRAVQPCGTTWKSVSKRLARRAGSVPERRGMGHKGRTPWPPELSGQLREVDRLRRGGRYEQALARIRQLAEAHPTQVRVLLEMGLTLGIWGRAPAEALPWFDR